MKNKSFMKNIAAILGIELKENFRLQSQDKTDKDTFFLLDDGIFVRDPSGNIDYAKASILLDILTGKETIVTIPYLPKVNEYYYYVTFESIGNGKYVSHIKCTAWRGSNEDFANYQLGNIFSTNEIATKNTQKIINRFTQSLS